MRRRATVAVGDAHARDEDPGDHEYCPGIATLISGIDVNHYVRSSLVDSSPNTLRSRCLCVCASTVCFRLHAPLDVSVFSADSLSLLY